ncbi:MAG TPA: hypothetical protein VEZ14_09835 [Dehalococcoidia bacterium]|nr:hypothetical protein [Dehalococcoidia bacterium]
MTGNARPAPPAPASADRYQKFLPEWMRDGSTVARPARPARPRRARPPRPAGGYTPGKMALGDSR